MAGPKNKHGSNKIKEHVVRDALCSRIGGIPEVLTPSGSIDVLTRNEVIEVKHYRSSKGGFGQVISYGEHYPSRRKRLHLFARSGDTKASKYVGLATLVCSKYGVHVTFEEVACGTGGGLSLVAGPAVAAAGATFVAAGGVASGATPGASPRGDSATGDTPRVTAGGTTGGPAAITSGRAEAARTKKEDNEQDRVKLELELAMKKEANEHDRLKLIYQVEVRKEAR